MAAARVLPAVASTPGPACFPVVAERGTNGFPPPMRRTMRGLSTATVLSPFLSTRSEALMILARSSSGSLELRASASALASSVATLAFSAASLVAFSALRCSMSARSFADRCWDSISTKAVRSTLAFSAPLIFSALRRMISCFNCSLILARSFWRRSTSALFFSTAAL